MLIVQSQQLAVCGFAKEQVVKIIQVSGEPVYQGNDISLFRKAYASRYIRFFLQY